MMATLQQFFSHHRPLMGVFGIVICVWFLTASGCLSQSGNGFVTNGTDENSIATALQIEMDEYEIVDCLLPGQLRRIGTHVTYVTPRRPIRTTAQDCAIRGGEFTESDRADYRTSLKIWLDAAQEGDAQAQYFVGTLYEKGPMGDPDYALAAAWYEKAAKQGQGQAAMNLGRLYEKGLGVSKDTSTAFKWYAQASGLGESELSMLWDLESSNRIYQLEQTLDEREQEIVRLRAQIDDIQKELAHLREQFFRRSAEVQTERGKLSALQSEYDGLQQLIQSKETGHEEAQRELRQLRERLSKETIVSEGMRLRLQELERVLAESQQDTTRERLEQELQAVRVKVDQQRATVGERESEIERLNQRIAALEQESAQRSRQLDSTPPVDLGFEGPAIDIIDPPVALTRGISVVEDVPSLSVPLGVSRRISGRVVAPAGLRSLTINGHPVQVDDQGLFTMDFPPLQTMDDSHAVQILAVDIQDKRAAKKLKLVAGQTVPLGPLLSDEDREVFGRYYALVIGNDRYEHWNTLQNAVADAGAVADILKNRYGFEVTFLENATRRDILKGLNHFRKTLKENDNFVVYYAGHGHLESDIDRGYWIPVDAELDDTSEWILTPSITDLLELTSAKHIMVIADSCFAGKLTRSSLAKLRPGLSEEARMAMLKTVAQKRVRTALTSGGEHPVLDIGEGGHSVFTGALLEVLEENQTILEAERLFLAIRTRVVNAANRYRMEQIPTYWPIQFAGHESLGDFIFIPQSS
jgi:hypothetical protein